MTQTQQEVLTQVKQYGNGLLAHCYIVYKWIWAEFENVPPEEVRNKLKELKFRWNPRRKAWQNACGLKVGANRKIDPRLKYGVVKIQEQEEVKL